MPNYFGWIQGTKSKNQKLSAD